MGAVRVNPALTRVYHVASTQPAVPEPFNEIR